MLRLDVVTRTHGPTVVTLMPGWRGQSPEARPGMFDALSLRMRTLILASALAASVLSAGCWVGPRARPVAHYHHPDYVRVGPPPPPRVYYERRHHYGDDRGYRRYHDHGHHHR